MTTVFVTNNTDHEVCDGYNGKFYDFPKGECVEVPIEIAVHVFGYDIEDKKPYLTRLGWVKSGLDYKEGLKTLALVDIQLERPRKNQSLSPLVERVPLPDSHQARGKILKAV